MVSQANGAFLEDLTWRGLIHQSTNLEGLKCHLDEESRAVYAGFDPTADSLTIGNLVPIMLLAHFQRSGHRPVVLVGGATGLIGDPSGKSAERQLLDAQAVSNNVNRMRPTFERLLSFSGPCAARLVDNYDWIRSLTFIDALRDIGKHFSVNMMLQKDSVKARLENREQGISYTEFSYMLLQAYDFLHLFQNDGVSVQVSGSDQWGNIVAGVDLIRRRTQQEAFGLTAPLITKADGGKFGKTENDAIWLSAERTSPYAYYQFWLNAADADVGRFLKMFTLFPREQIERLLQQHFEDPGKRTAQRALATETTRFLHGAPALERVKAASEALFSGAIQQLDEATLHEIFADAPSSEHSLAELPTDGLSLVELLPQTTLAKSKREAREFLSSGAVSLNGDPATLETKVRAERLLFGKLALIKRGKRAWHVTRWT